jgi:hypothetical protein
MDTSGIFSGPPTRSVNDAIRGAATATGASFEYLLAAAQAESGLNPQAASPTSSARGPYQFIDQTWRRRHPVHRPWFHPAVPETVPAAVDRRFGSIRP